MSLQYRRKLDLLNRVYFLNLGKIEYLDDFIPLDWYQQIKLDLYQVTSGYFNLQDTQLLLAGLSQKKLAVLFRNSLLEMIAHDINLMLNGKVLQKLQMSLATAEFTLVLEGKHNQDYGLTKLMTKYSFMQLLTHLSWVYFAKLYEKLPAVVSARFKPDLFCNDICTELDKIDIHTYIVAILTKIFPSINNAINSFKVN